MNETEEEIRPLMTSANPNSGRERVLQPRLSLLRRAAATSPPYRTGSLAKVARTNQERNRCPRSDQPTNSDDLDPRACSSITANHMLNVKPRSGPGAKLERV
jgi:hypothetical protein